MISSQQLTAGLNFSATCVISSYVMYEVIDLYCSIPRFNKLLAMRGYFRVESTLVAPHEYSSSVQAAELSEIKGQQEGR